MKCPPHNAPQVDESEFWDPVNGVDWDHHRIGWAIAGGCALITVLITTISVLQHCRNYTSPREQRQVIRILYMPSVYAVISFFSYRYFRSYTYYSFIYVAYEAVTISAFLLLLIEYVANTAVGHKAEHALARKDKRPLPMPFCCWRYRPTKAYFMYTVKWSVLQYVIVRPAVSVVGIICEKFDVLCETESFNPHFASVYLSCIEFISISIALYGLFVFFGLTKDELAGRRPLAKFMCIKLIVMFTFYQTFIFGMLAGPVIKPTQYWSETNIANGLNALAICIEMVFFALGMWWAYAPREYRISGAPPTSVGRPLWDSVNYKDFALEIMGSLHFYFGAMKGRHADGASSSGDPSKLDFGQAFGVAPISAPGSTPLSSYSTRYAGYEPDDIRLAPYPFSGSHASVAYSETSSTRSGGYGYDRVPRLP
ncbi:DUF300-domain-containing protein [Mycena rebaudengoi]|nr:DUF300-domain-containing protein [Mycena rebaudengoi]